MSTPAFDPKNIPDQSGRVFFITGGTAGLGLGSMRLIASANATRIFFSGRNKTKANELLTTLSKEFPKTEFIFIECDQADLSSVQSAAKQFLSQSDHLHCLMLNAGIMGLPAALTKDGYELQFGVNHLGHALLIKLLLPILERTATEPNADVRIVSLSSDGHRQAPNVGIDFATLKTKQASLGGLFPGPQWSRYGQSKLANLLYARELAKKYPSIKVVAVHPGFIKTDLVGNLSFVDRQVIKLVGFGKWIPVEQGGHTQTWAATTKMENLESGGYYEPVGVKTVPTARQANDQALADKLWSWTQEELEAYD